MKEWMTIKDLCEYLQISENKVRYLLTRGLIPYHLKLGSPRFFKEEIDAWMKEGGDVRAQKDVNETRNSAVEETDPFSYRGKSILDHKLTASKILIGLAAWNRLPDFVKDVQKAVDERNRSYLFRKEFEPLVKNFNDYLRVSCQIGLIENIRDGSITRYYPTQYTGRVLHAEQDDNIRAIILESMLDIVRSKKECDPKERHAIFLLWYLLEIKNRGLAVEEAFFNRGKENNYYPQIRKNFVEGFCLFLFGGDESKEQEFLRNWTELF